jgi:small subunit ribosomal protein S3
MGQKVNPISFRLKINRTWDSRWYASNRDYASCLAQDLKIRQYILDKMSLAAVSKIVIERPNKKARVTIYSARPGVIIGKKGSDIDGLKKSLNKIVGSEVTLNILEIRKPDFDARLIADSVARQIERRVSFRRAMKKAVQTALKSGVLGIKINCAGRLGGAEIARTEWYREGRVPLHTMRADIDYGVATAFTTYGACGIKVWIFKGDIMEHDPMAQDRRVREHVVNR